MTTARLFITVTTSCLFLITLRVEANQTFDLEQAIKLAPAASVLVVPAGIYYGHFEINKPLTLQGQGQVILDGNHTGTVLRLGAKDITIENIEIRHSGDQLGAENAGIIADGCPRLHLNQLVIHTVLFGVEVLNSPYAVIENSHISGLPFELGRRGDGLKIWYSPHTKVLSNAINLSRDILVWYSGGSLIQRNHIQNVRYGIHYMYSHQGLAEGNTIEHSSVGIYDMYSNDLTLQNNTLAANRGPSGFGIGVKESDRFKVLTNHIQSNRVGIHVDNSPLSPPTRPEDQAIFAVNKFLNNDVGVGFVGIGNGVLFHHNDFIDNWQQVSSRGSRHLEAVWQNNYWSDYRGIDPKKSGFGITPYHTASLADNITDRFEGFKLFNFSPTLLALEFAQKAVPWFTPDPNAVDEKPSMSPLFQGSIRSDQDKLFLRRLQYFACFAVFALSASLIKRGLAL
jgi:nitrous oxidase accessory protein